jgi:hypothetical protein
MCCAKGGFPVNSCLPYYCQTGNAEFFLLINEQGALASSRRTAPNPWENKDILLKDCRHFCAAPDKDGMLQVIAQDSKSQLSYFRLEENTTSQASFFIERAAAPFFLAFSVSGNGYFVSSIGGSNLITAFFTPHHGWSQSSLSDDIASVPLALAVDKVSGVHMIVFDRGKRRLSYILCDSGFTTVRSSFILDILLEIPHHPALWLDAKQSVHIAWHNCERISYRVKTAGGWPAGGWQSVRDFSLDEAPCLLSFLSSGETLSLWAKNNKNYLRVYDPSRAVGQSIQLPTELTQAVRVNSVGQVNINFSNEGTPDKWYVWDGLVPDSSRPITTPSQDEPDHQLLIHARRLMAEKKQLEMELRKKEVSLLQFRQMLEQSQENKSKQSTVLHEQVTLLDKKVRELRDEIKTKNKILATKDEEINDAHDRCLEVKKQLESYTCLYKESLAKTALLQEQLKAAEGQESELLSKIKMLQEELVQKKNVWKTIGDIFHKKPSGK